MRNHLGYMSFLIFAMVLGFLYRRFMDKYNKNDKLYKYDLIKKYLLTESSLAKSKKPIIWIHIPYELNSRVWESFGSRNTTNLNLPYMTMCIESVIRHCGNNFNICLIDDNSFNNFLPGWNINISETATPIKEKLRHLAIVKTIYNYGGMVVPPSFLCLHNLYNMYSTNATKHKPFIVETYSKGNNQVNFLPDTSFFGAQKNNEVLAMYSYYLENLISKDQTEESNFLQECNKWFYNQVFNYGTTNIVDGKQIGVKNMSQKPIMLEDLFSETYMDFGESMLGLYIDEHELLKRTNYNWFCYLNEQDIYKTKNVLGLLFLKSINN